MFASICRRRLLFRIHEILGGAGEAARAEVRSGAGAGLRVGEIGDGLLRSALTVRRRGDRPGWGTVQCRSGHRQPPPPSLLCPALGWLGTGVMVLAGHRLPPSASFHPWAIIIFSMGEYRLMLISAAQGTKEWYGASIPQENMKLSLLENVCSHGMLLA